MLSVVSVLFSINIVAENCTDKIDLVSLAELRNANFVIDHKQKRNRIAIDILSCIGHPEPTIRDNTVYQAYSTWLRGDQLEPKIIIQLYDYITAILVSQNQDEDNYTQPFAALIYSEVLRVDRISPYLNAKQRQKAVDTVINFVSSIKDYRGFDDNQGWRHSVAHSADIILQLSLNKNITKSQLIALAEALIKQVNPKAIHFYTYGEPNRLAMAFTYLMNREELSLNMVQQLLNDITDPMPFKDWQSVYTSNSGLSKIHNVRSFIYSLHALISESQNKKLKQIKPLVTEAIKKLG
jgi:hypothetical protein